MKEIKGLSLKSTKDLKRMDEKLLKKELFESKKKLFEFKIKLSASELKQTHLVKILRRYIATVKTIARENQISI